MDLSWLDKIAPRSLAKAAGELQSRMVDPDGGIRQSIEDEIVTAFQLSDEPPKRFLEGFRARYAAAALIRRLHSLSNIDDAKAARWIQRFRFDENSLLLFQFLVEHLFFRYSSEDGATTLGEESLRVLQERTVSSVTNNPSKLFAKSIIRFFSSPALSFENLASTVSSSTSSISEVARLAPFNLKSQSFAALCIKVALAGPARDAVDGLLGSRDYGIDDSRWDDVRAALKSVPLRVFSEVVSTALQSIQKRELYWMESGRINLRLKALISSRMMSPDTNPVLWRFVAPELVTVYNMLIRGEVVENFFGSGTDPARSTFWKNYTAAMTRMPFAMGSKKQVFLMIFKNVGVIETKQAGMGAAYFYSLEDIEKVFMQPENQAREHSFYKTLAPRPALYSLSHVGAWQNTFQVYMQRTYGIIPNGKI